MVQDGAQIRRRGAQDFGAYYDFVCARQESVPLPAVKLNLNRGILDFNGDRVKLTDWPPILSSIRINKQLHHIAISSTYQAGVGSGDADRRYLKPSFKKKTPAFRSKDMTFKLCKALRECLSISPKLKTLQINGLPLRERDLITLTKGLAKSVSLENLSLANCPIHDEGLEVICQSVKYSTNIRSVDFTGCNLTWRGAEHMASIIKHQGMQRHGTAWAESLRYRLPQFEGMRGLRRVTLNCNTLIGDRGAAALANELAEDLWVKAVDLQRCGLSSEGARRLLEVLKTNSTLCVLDIRSNPLVDKVLIKTVIEKVLMNSDGQSPEYCWIKPATTEPQRAPGPRRRSLPITVRGKGKGAVKIAPCKGLSPSGRGSGVAQTRSSYVPWRAAARAGRQRGMPPGVRVMDQSFQGAATVKVTMESDSEGEDDEEDEEEEVVVQVEQEPSSPALRVGFTEREFKRMQMELKECRLRLAEERRSRLKAESRLMELELENARLRDNNLSLSGALAATTSASAPHALAALEDEAVLESIESSFNKFHAFLDLLKDAGLGQLASLAGIDKSDFHPPGGPQLSSTFGPPVGIDDSAARGEYLDVRAKTDATSLVSRVPTAQPGKLAEATPPRSLSSARESVHEDRRLDITFNQPQEPAGDTCVGREDEPQIYSKPDTRRDSGSEYSSRSQKSSDKVSIHKTFQTEPDQPKSNRSNGSNGYSFHKSYSGSHASHSSGSHGGVSGRSSVSDIISDHAGSVGSAGSGRRGQGRLVSVGQSGSEWPEGKVYPGRETLNQIRSLVCAEGQSENDSF